MKVAQTINKKAFLWQKKKKKASDFKNGILQLFL